MSDDKRTFWLRHDEARRGVAEFAHKAPEGWKVTFEPPTRTLDQNSLLWPLLECFAKQLQWPVNGRMVHMSKEDWKDTLTAAFRQETVRLAMGLTGGVVMLGEHTSKMSKQEFSEFIEFIQATAADRGVNLERNRETENA